MAFTDLTQQRHDWLSLLETIASEVAAEAPDPLGPIPGRYFPVRILWASGWYAISVISSSLHASSTPFTSGARCNGECST